MATSWLLTRDLVETVGYVASRWIDARSSPAGICIITPDWTLASYPLDIRLAHCYVVLLDILRLPPPIEYVSKLLCYGVANLCF